MRFALPMLLRATLLLTLLPAGVMAAESAPFTTQRDSVTLVSEADSVAPGKPVRLGLHFRLASGWHTYWSNPGDAGSPPTVEMSGAAAGSIVYPAPERLTEGPFTSFAYTGEVLLPFLATPAQAAGPLSATVHATWLVCATICVPEETSFHLDLPSGTGAPGAQAALFAAADARTPRASPFAAHVTQTGTLWLAAPKLSLRSAQFFPAEPGVIDHGAVQPLTVRPDRIELALKPLKPGLGSGPAHLAGVLSLTDSGGQVENLAIDASPAPLPNGGGDTPGLLRALLLAFAGGLILNLMPCVLPVLAIKALALARLSGAARAHVRREVAAYTLGVVGAFFTIGVVMLGVRALGGAAGWGMQFQSAGFTSFMALLLFAVGLNLSGVYMVGGTLAGSGQSLASRGAFFTGLLAVVVATPCTAPFMGAALAAALILPPAAGLLVFVALGLGMAAPYAALALSPRVAGLLPRPGAWMDTLKHVLAFPMYGAALWLVWVASQQTGPTGLASVFAAALLTGFAAWAYGYGQMRGRSWLLDGAALVSLVGLAALLTGLAVAAPLALATSGGTSRAADGSVPYSAGRLASLRAAHRPVLVDMTAAWCVTCLVNERLALDPQAVRDAFLRHDVTTLKGDWTRGDADITAYLRQFDRSGVPLYVYYPVTGEPVVLPQILTPGIVLAHLS